MRVLHVLAQLPMRTGSGVSFKNRVEGLARRGVENALIYGTQEPYEIDFGMTSYPVVFKTDEINFPIVGMSDEMPYENTLYSKMSDTMISIWQNAFLKRLEKAKKEFQPDLVISHHLWFLTSMVLDVFKGTPVIGISHGTDIRQAQQNNHLRYKYVKNLNRLDHVLALSNKEKKEVVEIFNVDEDKITIVGGGFDQDIFYDNGKEKKDDVTRIVFAGKLARSKGIYELAKAFPNLKRKFPKLRMFFIGTTSQEEEAILYENAHFCPGFKIFDVVNQEKLGKIMRRADIFVLPSYYEGLGLTAIEALACKMRVVATEIPGLMELLGDDVNNSNVIEYVKPPKIYDTDKPQKSHIDPFVERLELALEKQILRTEKKEEFPEDIYRDIYSHAWDQIVEREYEIIKEVIENKK